MSLRKGNITISGLGSAGYSPSASVSQSGDTTTISITDKTGTTSASIDLSDKQDIMQYSTMPTASSSNEGKIVQYIGTTTNDYTNGYFYKCVSDEEETPTYSWENVEVQTSGGGNENVFWYDGTVNATNLAMFQQILDLLNAGKGVSIYLKDKVGNKYYPCGIEKYGSSSGSIYLYIGYVNSGYIYSGATSINVAGFTNNVITYISDYALANIVKRLIPHNYNTTDTNDCYVLATNNTKSYTPSANYHPSTKKYVDDNVNPTITTDSSTADYTIASLTGNQTYKLGELTSLTITATTTFDKESVIYFTSGSTATSVSLPDSITNLGDAPAMTTASNVNTGTCEASKSYIIAILNNIAVWKAY